MAKNDVYTIEGQQKYIGITLKLHAQRTLETHWPKEERHKEPTDILTREEINDLIALTSEFRPPQVRS